MTLREDGTVNFTVDSATNRYTAIGGNSISHDDAGNLTVDKDGYQYTYDYENRVVKIEDASSNDAAEYACDALGRRIRMIDKAAEADAETLYYYNPAKNSGRRYLFCSWLSLVLARVRPPQSRPAIKQAADRSHPRPGYQLSQIRV